MSDDPEEYGGGLMLVGAIAMILLSVFAAWGAVALTDLLFPPLAGAGEVERLEK